MEFPTHIVAVAGFIRNEDNKILLLKHPSRGWEFPGGKVEIGEDLISALKREVEEETGIFISVGQLVGVYSNIKTGIQYDGVTPITTKVMLDFLGKMESGVLQTSNESLKVGWFEGKKVLDLITNSVSYYRANKFLSFDGKVTYSAYSKNPFKIHVESKI